MTSTSGGQPGVWGPTSRVPRGGGSPTYSSITAINTSEREKKNILEVRLEKQQGASFNLSMEEVENLLKRLHIDGSHLEGVSACPEGKPVVLITLHPSVDITRFLNRNESYIVKQGVRTTTIRQEGKKDKVIRITGLHPNTKDQAVVKYLAAHGKVSTTEKVIHHVFPGDPGSSLLAGKLNGNRSYVVDELNIPLGSYHIIDGEKVSIRYSGQEWTCARCHQLKSFCPGAAVARNCTADRILLSDHMKKHWDNIGYQPDNNSMNEVDQVELEVQVGGKSKSKEPFLIPESILASKYNAVIIKGFKAETPLKNILQLLSQAGFLKEFKEEFIVRNENTGNLTLSNLKPEECILMMESMHGKRFLGRQVFLSSVVDQSPVKAAPGKGTCTYSGTSPETAADTPPGAATGAQGTSSGTSTGPAPKLNTGPVPGLVPVQIEQPEGAPLQVENDLTSDLNSSIPSTNSDLSPSSVVPSEKLISSGTGLASKSAPPPVSPSVQEKIDLLEQQNPDSKFPGMTPLESKRKSEGSPEADLSRKDKKIQKSEGKKTRKQEGKVSRTLNMQKTF